MKKLLCFVTVFTLILSCGAMPAAGTGTSFMEETNSLNEEKMYCMATLEDSFKDDSIILVLTNTASLEFKDYIPADFPEVSCNNVRNLTSYTTADVEERAIAVVNDLQGGTMSALEVLNCGDTQMFSSYHQILLLTLEETGKQQVLDAIHALEEREDVLAAEPNYILEETAMAPNDTYYSQQYACDKIDLPDAWSETTGSSYIYVGVVDSGIDASHPDLQSRVDQSLSRNFYWGEETIPSTISDDSGHGTHVAGIIGAAGNNGTGISGVCWNVKLVSLRISSNNYNASIDALVAAIDYATNSLRVAAIPDIRVLNVSLGTTGNISTAFRTAALRYGGYGGVIVCAAGNNNMDTDTTTHYPSWFTTELYNVISVGASNSQDGMWNSSNYGDTTVDIFAPGDSILSCYPVSKCSGHSSSTSNHKAPGYHYMSGTSMATPYVTGTIALMYAANPNLAVNDVKSCINITADDLAAFNGKCVSDGRLNAYKAVLEAIARDYT